MRFLHVVWDFVSVVKAACMEDIGLFKQAWKWLKSQKVAFVGTQLTLVCIRDRLVFLVDQHWPLVCRWSWNLGKFMLKLIWLWRDCVIRGLTSLIGLGSTALFVIFWSSFLSLASTACLLYVLLSLVSCLLLVCCAVSDITLHLHCHS